MKQEGSTCTIPAQSSVKESIKYLKESAKDVYKYVKENRQLEKIVKEKGRDSPEFEAFVKGASKPGPSFPDAMQKACSCGKDTTDLVVESNMGKAIKATAPLAFIPVISWPLGAAAIPVLAYLNFRRQEKEVPGCVKDLPVKKFDASWAGLVSIDPLMGIKSLESVNVPNNNLQDFPDISDLENLSFMNLDHNAIPPFTCGTAVDVKKANRKFMADELWKIRECMKGGNELRYGKKLSLLGYNRGE